MCRIIGPIMILFREGFDNAIHGVCFDVDVQIMKMCEKSLREYAYLGETILPVFLENVQSFSIQHLSPSFQRTNK